MFLKFFKDFFFSEGTKFDSKRLDVGCNDSKIQVRQHMTYVVDIERYVFLRF